MLKFIQQSLTEHLTTTKKSIVINENKIEETTNICIKALTTGNKIILFGNGGSAADAQHIAAELVGRYKHNRQALAAISLSADTSAITSIGNDYGYEQIFSRQIEALAKKDDVVIAISTSGTSKNVITAIKKAKEINCKIIGLSGYDGGDMNKLCHINMVVKSNNTPRIQETHITIGHIICELIDKFFNENSNS